MRTLPFKQVDVFTGKPFLGNPVAVVIDADGLDTPQMQRIARWTNLSETTFVMKPTQDADYRLRIFTPHQELPFAGHPTLGSAHAVLESGFVKPRNGTLRQECGAGVLRLTIEKPRLFVRAPVPRVSPAAVPLFGKSRALRVDVGPVWVVVDLGEAADVDSLSPDMTAISELSDSQRARILSADNMRRYYSAWTLPPGSRGTARCSSIRRGSPRARGASVRTPASTTCTRR